MWRGGSELCDVALDHGVDAVPRDGLAAAVQEHRPIVGALASEATQFLDGVGPERASPLLAVSLRSPFEALSRHFEHGL